MKMTKFMIDYENNSERWLENAQNETNPPELADLIEAEDHDSIRPVYVTDERGRAILEWAELVPGWKDGPDYAPTALYFQTGIDLETVLSLGNPLARVWIGGNCWRLSE